MGLVIFRRTMPQQIICHRQQLIPNDMGSYRQLARAWLSIQQVMQNAWLHAGTHPLQKAYTAWKLGRQYIAQYPRAYLRETGLQLTLGLKLRVPEKQIDHQTLRENC